MDDNELEYRLPAKVLTNRDPILMNRLSIREFLQWGFFFGLIYISFNLLPFDFPIRLVIGASLAMFAALFIHAPINGLGGIEWLFIWLRFRLEKRRHQTQPPVNISLITNQKPTIQVAMSLPNSSKRLIEQPDPVQDQFETSGTSEGQDRSHDQARLPLHLNQNQDQLNTEI